jgi:hypothetical protein
MSPPGHGVDSPFVHAHVTLLWVMLQEHRLVQGSKDIFHIEAFVAKVMAVYKRWFMEMGV